MNAQFLVQSVADGYTLMFAASPSTTLTASTPSARYNTLLQFAPVGMVAMLHVLARFKTEEVKPTLGSPVILGNFIETDYRA